MNTRTLQASAEAFCTVLIDAMRDGEKFRIELNRKVSGLSVAVIPALAKATDDLGDDAQAVRAALAIPLLISGRAPEDLAEQFAARIEQYGAACKPAVASYDEMMQVLGDAAATARNATEKKTGGGGKGKREKDADTVDAEAGNADKGNVKEGKGIFAD